MHIDDLNHEDQFELAPDMWHFKLHIQPNDPFGLRLEDIELELRESCGCALELRVKLQRIEEEMFGEDDAFYFEATAHYLFDIMMME